MMPIADWVLQRHSVENVGWFNWTELTDLVNRYNEEFKDNEEFRKSETLQGLSKLISQAWPAVTCENPSIVAEDDRLIQCRALASRTVEALGRLLQVCIHCQKNILMKGITMMTESHVRRVAAGEGTLSLDERAWMLDQIAAVEGYKREDYETASTRQLAVGVLSAWTDLARDKGLL